jgi:hypothetical protein
VLGKSLVYVYGVTRGDVEGFVERNGVVREFLGKYAGRGSFWDYARTLAMFFRWLRVVEGLELSPEMFLNEHVRRRNMVEVRDRGWASRLVIMFCRDNPDFAGCAETYRHSLFNVLKQFFAYHGADLSNSHVWNGRRLPKFNLEQLSVETAKKYLGLLGQREKTICLVMLQSGMSIGDVLNKFNYQLKHVQEDLANGANRIRVDFDERKRNNFQYFTFIGADGCQELRVWLKTREQWLREIGRSSDAVFITRKGTVLTRQKFECIFYQKICRLGLHKNAFSFRSHMFRRMFKTESSPPERGINSDYVEFMMGHRGGVHSVGGPYDRTPELYADVVEKEFAKLEPWLNIYTGRHSTPEDIPLSEGDWNNLKNLLEDIRQGRVIMIDEETKKILDLAKQGKVAMA